MGTKRRITNRRITKRRWYNMSNGTKPKMLQNVEITKRQTTKCRKLQNIESSICQICKNVELSKSQIIEFFELFCKAATLGPLASPSRNARLPSLS